MTQLKNQIKDEYAENPEKVLNEDELKDEEVKTIDAVIRNLEIIGEATKNIPAKFRKNYKDIPWEKIIGMRNKVAHEYFGIDKEILWKTITEDIPTLKKEIFKVKKSNKDQTLF